MTPSEFEEVSKSLPSRRSAPPSSTYKQGTVYDLKAAHRRTASSLSKRRSVMGMRGLMPLALSPPLSRSPTPSSSSTAATTPAVGMDNGEQKMGARVDEYFAETLARDLDTSTEVFAAKNMTAGRPTTPASPDARRKSSSSHRASLPASLHSTSLRLQPLDPIEERKSTVFLDSQTKPTTDELSASDLESNPGTDTSGAVAPPSIRRRQQSVETVATSLASTSNCLPPKGTPSLYNRRQLSWIMIDSDDEDASVVEQQQQQQHRDRKHLPRPPTPPEDSDLSFDSYTCNRRLHQKSHSVSGANAPVSSPRKHHSIQSLDAVGRRRPSSASRRRERLSKPTQPATRSLSLRRRPLSLQYSGTRNELGLHLPVQNQDLHVIDDSTYSKRFSAIAIPSPDPGSACEASAEDCTEAEEASGEDAGTLTGQAHQTLNNLDIDSDDDLPEARQFALTSSPQQRKKMLSQPSPPPSPVLNNKLMSNTLDAGGSLYDLPCEESAKGVPLPPEVMDTLRVSIACFPETMLLSSSLTIETIRSYARKLRHGDVDLLRDLHADYHNGPRVSLWKRMKGHRRPSGGSDHQRHGYLDGPIQAQLGTHNSASFDGPKPWMPLRHVFGCQSDYICDALYAHLVAYNYISTLVPRIKPTSSHSGQQNSRSSRDSEKPDDIPRKAASLLGLSSPSASPVKRSGPKKLTRKVSLNLSGLRFSREMAPPSSMVPPQETAARDIQSGLMLCIVRLMETAKTMAERGSREDKVSEVVPTTVDKPFTRSLCEIVRISEEAILSF